MFFTMPIDMLVILFIHNIWKYTGNVNMAKINERYYRRKWFNRGVQEYEYSSLINTSYAAFKTACKTIHK